LVNIVHVVQIRNNVASVALHDAAHVLCQGVLYFQKVLRIHGTCLRVFVLTSVTIVTPFCANIKETGKCQTALYACLLYRQ